jgi:hypothetical protein
VDDLDVLLAALRDDVNSDPFDPEGPSGDRLKESAQ